MRILGAYLLAVLGGNAAPTKNDVTKILDSVGIKADAVSQIRHINNANYRCAE
jgi:large subunit ribosomal protein LP2